MSLVHNPQILARIKVLNMREEERLQRHLVDLDHVKQARLHVMKQQRQDLVKELRANKMREMRSSARQTLALEDKLALDLEAARGKPTPVRTLLRIVPDFEATRGFSKVDVEEEDDIYLRAAKMSRSQTAQDTKMRQTGTKDRSATEDPEVPDDDILVYSPTEVKAGRTRRKTIHIVPVSSTILSLGYKRRGSNVAPTSGLRRSLSQPSYVDMLQKMEVSDNSFSHHTDGSMALSMRRFQQRQRERMATLPGHLPVRRRPIKISVDPSKTTEEDVQPEETKLPAVRGIAWTPNATKMRFHIPKSARASNDKESAEENSRILRIRQAGQADTYEAALRSTSAFLGARPASVGLVRKVALTREETFLLDKLKRSASTSDLQRSTPSSS